MYVYIFERKNMNLETPLNDKRALNIHNALKLIAKTPEENPMKAASKSDVIAIDPMLRFTVDDIVDDWSFGNGVSVQQIRLKDGTRPQVVFCVFPSIQDPSILKPLVEDTI